MVCGVGCGSACRRKRGVGGSWVGPRAARRGDSDPDPAIGGPWQPHSSTPPSHSAHHCISSHPVCRAAIIPHQLLQHTNATFGPAMSNLFEQALIRDSESKPVFVSDPTSVSLLGTRGAVLHHSAETVLCFRIHFVLCSSSSS